ncbi:hypothetical protein FCM35_KLT03570 [Carex littledalei]|uniref:KIB1-4 beta-propeller domain-containing protein n=1 Tax=Carex littledalei TaxID=544730 RepID=A0A833RAL9_9POAL|nr:hypothetical protein FCM35_KLT03570 [Carex littledalei]
MEDLSSAIPDWAHLPLAMKPHHLPLQLPWLMIPYSISRCTVDDGFRLFYDLWEAKIRKISLPDTIGYACCASYRGWLLLVASGGTELFLLNPLTRARVQLPPFNIPVKDISDDKLHHMVALLSLTNAVSLPDAAYNNGIFYLYYEGEIMAFYNLNEHKVLGTYFFEPELRSVSKFFLVGKSGFYMVVVHPTAVEYRGRQEALEATRKPPKQKIELYQVIDEEGQMDVKRIADTSDTTIFYGDNYHYLTVNTDE